MTEPTQEASEAGLVERQGVDAAPAPPQPSSSGDVRSGGKPERSEQMDEPVDRDQIVGPPDQERGGPGQELALGEG